MREASVREKLILDLHTVKAIKFGKFKLKSGVVSPYYLDLRILVSYPYLLGLTAEVFWEKLRTLYFDIVVGVPYTAIPIATAIALKHNRHMIFTRKERKMYGTRRRIEGEYHQGQKAVVIDDVITNGDSKLETITPLEKTGLSVKDIVVLLDRGQGGPAKLQEKGYVSHSLFTMNDLFEILLNYKRIDRKIVDRSFQFMKKMSE